MSDPAPGRRHIEHEEREAAIADCEAFFERMARFAPPSHGPIPRTLGVVKEMNEETPEVEQ